MNYKQKGAKDVWHTGGRICFAIWFRDDDHVVLIPNAAGSQNKTRKMRSAMQVT